MASLYGATRRGYFYVRGSAMKKRKHVANWLSNLSVAMIVVGMFQTVDFIPNLPSSHAKWLALGFGIALFLVSYAVARREDL